MSFDTFQLRKLRLTGADGEKEVAFSSGLNVVSGPSNTGKSYILASIDFTFGAKSTPKPIEQSQMLTEVAVELHTASGSRTLERRWDGDGDILVFSSPIELIRSQEAPVRLRPKHDSNYKDNIATFLLSLFNSDEVEVRKNKSKTKQKLSFRTISHFFLVSETDIISENSPILGTMMYERTVLQSAFNYLLTGNTDQSLIDGPDPKTTKAKKIAQIEVYSQLIDEIKTAVKDKSSQETVVKELKELDEKIHLSTEQVTQSSGVIAEKLVSRAVNWRQLQECDSRLIVLHELDQRFDLLSKHYASDLQRLDFIADGAFALDQLQNVGCPVCGSTSSSLDLKDTAEVSRRDALQKSCEGEAEQIRILSRDLAQTREDLNSERDDLINKSRSLKEEIESIDAMVQAQLTPTVAAVRAELDELLKRKRELFQLEERWKRLSDYEKKKAKLEIERDAIKEGKKASSILDPVALHNFCQEIRNLLIEWHFITTEMVEFDEATVDIKVGGKPRKSNGKGVRALLHAAFTIGLMRYCIKGSLPHPGFVILDSPLTTFRGNDSKSVSEEVSGDVQQRFFESLAGTPTDQQIIILENKSIPPETRSNVNYLEFVGKGGSGRSGLL